MRMEWGTGESPFGTCSLGWDDLGICHLAFHDRVRDASREVQACRPQSVLVRRDEVAREKIRDIFFDEAGDPIPVFARGTEFQRKVWRELISIPDGKVATYSGIASAIGHPHAARAVGSACGANPVAWLIPCHRVIRATGAIEGYRWGTARKRSMLAAEAAALKE